MKWQGCLIDRGNSNLEDENISQVKGSHDYPAEVDKKIDAIYKCFVSSDDDRAMYRLHWNGAPEAQHVDVIVRALEACVIAIRLNPVF